MLYIALWDPPDEPRRPRSVLENPLIRRYVENWGSDDGDDFGLATCAPKTGEPVGAVWARCGPDSSGPENYGCDYPELGIGIRPEHQGMGIGSRLMDQFIESLRPRVDGLRLGVHPRNSPAKRLYEKFGFVEFAIGAGDYPQMKLEF